MNTSKFLKPIIQRDGCLGCKITLNCQSGEIVKERSIGGLRHFLDSSFDSDTYMFVSLRESGNTFFCLSVVSFVKWG